MTEQPLIDISPENWQIVSDILQRLVPDREVWAFGSRAKWSAKEYSDLDIAIIGEEPLGLTRTAELTEAFQESALPFKVDVVDWATITPSFQNVLEASKVILNSSHPSDRKTVDEVPIETLTDGSPITYGVVKPGLEVEGGVLFIRGGDVVNGKILTGQLRTISKEVSTQYSRTLLSGGELLISLVGNPGEVALVPPELKGANIARQVGLVRLSPKKVEPDYVQYFLRSSVGRKRLFSHSKGSVQQVINLGDLKTLKIPLPPRNEQIGIAETMRAFDDRIGLLQETNATLEAIAQALFKSWFVDFDPVRAKAEGREPEGVPPEIAELFPSEFEESELGEIPKGWSAIPVYSLAEYINGAAYKAFSPNSDGRGLPIIKIAELKAGISPQTAYSEVEMQNRYRIDTGDILLSWSGNPDTSIDTFVWHHGNAWLNQHIFRVVVNDSKERPFVLQTLKYLRPVFAELARNKQTTGLGHFTVADMKRLLVVRPEAIALIAFGELLGPIQERIFENELQAISLATLRDMMLPRLMSGQLDPVEADA